MFSDSEYHIEQLYFIDWDKNEPWNNKTIILFASAVINSTLMNSIKLISLSESNKIKKIAEEVFKEVGLHEVNF